MVLLSFGSWWKALKTNHAVLGIVHYKSVEEESGKPQDFSLWQRYLFLAMAIGAAWPGVFLKYFYLKGWIPLITDQAFEDLHLYPPTGLDHLIDSALCAIVGSNVDMVLGRELVRGILKKDWQTKGGAHSAASFAISGYAVLLTCSCFAHLAYTLFISKPHLAGQLLIKYLTTLVIKLVFVETATTTMKAIMAARTEAKKDA
eukprot:TRINITY_DN83494_c0_g1_i1.p1 TRINITY_DN83494_c0_g1~~TRINITY_DN83494_c0_g1_i1.p1  ORF type:complete len:202 (+),score=19.85 TRINITY_DN83494_c0_g1_i1:56-661(+)